MQQYKPNPKYYYHMICLSMQEQQIQYQLLDTHWWESNLLQMRDASVSSIPMAKALPFTDEKRYELNS